MVQIGRFDIRFAVPPLNHLLVAPREGHLKRLVKIFSYLQNDNGIRKIIVISPKDIREISCKGANTVDWLEDYPNASEDIDEGIPEPRGRPISTTV